MKAIYIAQVVFLRYTFLHEYYRIILYCLLRTSQLPADAFYNRGKSNLQECIPPTQLSLFAMNRSLQNMGDKISLDDYIPIRVQW